MDTFSSSLREFINALCYPHLPDISMVETPKRFIKAFEEITSGYNENPDDHIKIFELKDSAKNIVSIKDIEFYSLCEHHLLPFFGKVSISYKPRFDRVLGLSKFGRIVDVFAKRFQVQERLTSQIANFLLDSPLKPEWVKVTIEAQHLCQVMRGSKKQNPRMVTFVLLNQKE